jgi:hypothetical protein
MEKYLVQPDWVDSDGSKNLETRRFSTNWQVIGGELKKLVSKFPQWWLSRHRKDCSLFDDLDGRYVAAKGQVCKRDLRQ